MVIFDKKHLLSSLLHALAQPRKGFIYENSKIKIYGHLWLIYGYF